MGLLLQVRQDLQLEQCVGPGRRVPLVELKAGAAAPRLYVVGCPRLPRGWLGGQIWELDPVAACKGKLPLSVFLVINDNPYGLMFSLRFL
jgi:hypothetical protein